MNYVPAHMVNGRGFVKAHCPEKNIDEVIMNAQQQMESIESYKQKIKPFLKDAKKSAEANAMMKSLSAKKRKLKRHIDTVCNRDSLLVKRLRMLVTPEQFAVAVGMAESDKKAITSQIQGIYDD